MALEFSSNWKKLQAQLPQNPSTKRKHGGVTLIRPKARRTSMEYTASSLKSPKGSPVLVSRATWAEDNELFPRHITEIDNVGLGVTYERGSSSHQMSASLSKDVEIGQYVGLDCEMVGVGGEENRSALARVSIVNYHGTQVYDSFVKPKETVTDWRTHISGVSPKDMSTARSFDEVRDDVAELLKGRILVGHDLRHDLEVLMLLHPGEDKRDTSRLPGFRKYNGGKTPSLKKLAKEILGIDIQEGQHSSIEDSQVTMLLFRKHRQAFDAEHLRRFPERKTGNTGGKTKRKRKGKVSGGVNACHSSANRKVNSDVT